jgi:hypothetical protein
MICGLKKSFTLLVLLLVQCGSKSMNDIDTDTVKVHDIIFGDGKDTAKETDSSFIPDIQDIDFIYDSDTSAACTVNSQCPLEKHVCKIPDGICVECETIKDCSGDEITCIENQCKPFVCEPDSKKCVDTVSNICNKTGSALIKIDCAIQKVPCIDGICGKCQPNQKTCEGNQKTICNEKGTDFTVEDCAEKVCLDGECMVCAPEAIKCENDNLLKCNSEGTEYILLEECKPDETGKICKDGQCISLCEINDLERTNAGCEYWPMDLDQNLEFEAENMQFAVIVSNTSPLYDAHVKVMKSDAVEQEVTVLKNDLAIILLDPFNISDPGVGKFARRLKTTVPVVAYQFNPLENVGVFSNDASLLFPTNVLGKEYRVMTWKARNDNLSSYFTVAAVEDGDTEVKFKVTAPTLEGTNLPALSSGQEATVVLKQFETLHVKTSQACTDLTGTYIKSDKKIAVMGGHECANVPAGPSCGGAFCCCDHLEDQVIAIEAWGKHYLLGRTFERGKAPDMVKVLAAQDGTEIKVAGASVSIPVLNEGQSYEFEVTTDIELTSEKPFLAAQFLESQTSPTGCLETCEDVLFDKKCDGDLFGKSCDTDEDCCPGVAGIGDPALIISVPVEQFRKEYIFLVPNKYAKDYVNIIIPAGESVSLDGNTISSSEFTSITDGKYFVARKEIPDGTHRITSEKPINIMVYGWDQYVSYGYAGGMNVNTINLK